MLAGRFTVVAISIVLSAGCSKSDAAVNADSASAGRTEPASTSITNAAPTPPSNGNSTAVTVDEIDKWQLGLTAELKAVQEAQSRLGAAKSGKDSLDAMMAATEISTLGVGAQAAGLDDQRYGFVRSRLSDVVLALAPLLLDMNPGDQPPGFAEKIRHGGDVEIERMKVDVPTPVVESMRPRSLQLRKLVTDLIAARLKVAGGGQPAP